MSDPPIQVEAGIVLQPIDEGKIRQVMERFERRVEESLDKLEAIKASLDLKLTVDDGELRNAVALHDDLDAATNTHANVTDGGLDDARKKHDALNEATNTKANVDDTAVGDLKTELEKLRNLEAIQIGIQLVTNIDEVLARLQSLPGISGLIEGEQAGALVAGRTSLSQEQGTTVTNQLFEQNFGDTREQVAGVVSELSRMGVEYEGIADAAASAFQVAQTNGVEVTDVIRAQTSMVNSGLVASYREAGDVLQTSFELGLDRGGELLDTYSEYSSSIAELGLNVGELTNIFDSGLAAGFDNVDRIADLIRETTLRALNPDETAAQDALSALGLADETAALRAGEITGGEFLNGVRQALLATEDPGRRQALATAIFGTQSEDFGLQAALALDPVNQVFDTFEDRALLASEEFNNTLAATVQEFFRSVDGEAQRFLSSDQIDLDGKLAAIREGLEGALAALQGGASLGEAIEVGFKIEGFDENLDRLESIFGNFVLMLGDVAIAFADLTHNTTLADSLRDAIRPMAENQLAFDLKLTDADSVQTAVSSAIRRGVDQADVAAALATSIGELRAEGNFGQIGTILEGALSSGLFHGGAESELQTMADQLAMEAQSALQTALASGDFDMVTSIVDSLQGTALESGIQGTLIDAFRTAIDSGNLIDAGAIAAQIDDPAVTAELERTVGEWRAIIENELAKGNYTEALNAAELTGQADLAREAIQALNDSLYGQALGAPGGRGGAAQGPLPAAGMDTGGTVFDRALQAIDDLTLRFTEKQPIISEKLQVIQTDVKGIDTTAQVALPATEGAFGTFVEGILEITDPLLARIDLIMQGIMGVADAANELPGIGTGETPADATMPESRDVGGRVTAGQPYMVNGEIFVPPSDAWALGMDTSRSLMSMFDWGALPDMSVDNSRSTTINVQQTLNAQSTAQAVAAGSRFSDQLRGF